MSARARARRWDELERRFPDLAAMRVLDLGGLPDFWRSAPTRPAEVTTVTLVDADAPESWLRHLVDDACAPDRIKGERFDLVVSNSLIEHVGGHTPRQALADVVHAFAERHWVQTPYRYFPVEPHWVFPGLQFLPVNLRAAVVRHWPFSHAKLSGEQALTAVLTTDLISLTEMRLLFPDSTVWHEKAFGLTKSLVAVRT
ncbi:class I SAM-dependent methyltransferase [Actinokineospora sp. NPDC004072]